MFSAIAASASLCCPPSISEAALLVKNFSLPDSHCSESHSAEERCVCASESRKVLSGDGGKGLGKEGGVETGMAAALTATGVLYSMWVHGRS